MTSKQLNKLNINTQAKAYIFALMSVFLWSTVATAFKFALSNFSYIDLLAGSSLVSFLCLLSIAILQGKFKQVFDFDYLSFKKAVLFGFLNPFLYYCLLFIAYSVLPAQEALSLNYTWAAWLLILSSIILKEKLKLVSIFSILFSTIGIVIIASKGQVSSFQFNNPLGVGIALSSALIWAMYWILNLQNEGDKIINLTRNFLFGTIFSIILWFFSDFKAVVTSKALLSLVYVGLFEMGITFFFWLKALSLTSQKSKVTNLIYLSPFISLLLISTFTGEKILFSTVIGLILIIFGIVLEQVRN
jgi:drug/metabolite transporter (DMT)-like permease